MEGSANPKNLVKEDAGTIRAIASLTGLRTNAIESFIDVNHLDEYTVYDFVKKGKLADRMDFMTAVAGNPNNSVYKKVIAQLKGKK